MTTVLLMIHIMVALALVGVVLLQRSEGGALGIGGGGGGFMTGRSARQHGGPPSILSPVGQGGGGLAPLQMPAAPAPAAPSAPSAPSVPQAPQSQ
jgi:preprotein translocase subunit SecG